jgi:hypothetical protein
LLYDTLMMVAEATETCQWIMYDRTYFVDVRMLVYYVVKYALIRG